MTGANGASGGERSLDVIVVARLGVTTRDDAQALREQLDRLGAPLIGVVANGVKVKRRGKYGYGYGYYGRQPEAEGVRQAQ